MLIQLFRCIFAICSVTLSLCASEIETPLIPALDIESDACQGVGGSMPFGKPIDLYKEQEENLKNASLYFYVTAFNHEKFVHNLINSLQLNYDRLNSFGVDFQIILTCDGRREDYDAFSVAFQNSKIPAANVEVILNAVNKGCSLTRYEQLDSHKDKMLSDLNSGKSVYFSIFDGDDMVHQDYFLLLLATALRTGADVVGIDSLGVKCTIDDVARINNLQTRDLTGAELHYVNYHDHDSTTLIARVQDTFPKFLESIKDKDLDFETLLPVTTSSLFPNKVSVFYSNYRFLISLTEDTKNSYISNMDNDYPAMFFYLQHSTSMEHSLLKITLRNFGRDEERSLNWSINNDYFDFLALLFGCPLGDIDEIKPLIKTDDRNIDITEKFLVSNFKYMHQVLARFKDKVQTQNKKSTDNDQLQHILKETKLLQEQDISKPLSENFIKAYYKKTFDILLGKISE